MNTLPQLTEEFQSCTQQGLSVCQFIERGQANTPLGDLFEQLQRGASNKPLGITLLGLSEDARSAALKWLYGHNFAVFSLEVCQQIGLLEVHLKERGYSLEKSTGERQEFDSWDDFMAAIGAAELFEKSANAAASGAKGALKIGTEAPTGVRNLQVLMPENSAFVAESPALLTRLLTESNLLMVAAAPDYQLTEVDKQVIKHLQEDMVAFWPLLPVDELSEDLAIPEKGWWTQWHSIITLPPTLLTTHIDAAIPAHLAEVRDELRMAMQLALQVKRQVSATDALSDRYEQELKQLQSRKKREARKSSQDQSQAPDLTFWSQLRTEINDECQAATRALQEASRKRELGSSTGNAQLKQHTDSLTIDDLEREDGYKTVKLTLGKQYQSELMRFLQHNSKQALQQDLQSLQSALQAAADRLAEKCAQQLGYKPVLAVPAPDEKSLWQDMVEMIGLELRYQGELPKRGFIDRLSEGRKGAMALMMSVMLLGYIGVDLRTSGWLGMVLVPVFIGTIIYTFISFKKDEAHRVDKELSRVREELLASSRRLSAEISRLKQTKLAEYTDALKKQWSLQLEQTAKDVSARTQAERDQIAHRARTRIGAIDTQLSEWQNYRLTVQRLITNVQQLHDKMLRYLKSVSA
ncbi:hypothetical protein [Simiduia aestuariiviva]|uniref:Uncharacterized protein n=1 Tax=Simiduia aestuariiviva TaxID=1510459 RepID=A0A839URL8_9GAMM|nr:hypothetical protein [Simiduia aestuariiviva]MBB3168025.1 hypothetical protein [Simiduia aestuariiviva]